VSEDEAITKTITRAMSADQGLDHAGGAFFTIALFLRPQMAAAPGSIGGILAATDGSRANSSIVIPPID
jgi:hypothetical protein